LARPRNRRPVLFIVAGLAGIAAYFVADHFRAPIIPTNDFGRGLWFGICFGAVLLGGLLLIRPRP
jgi:hypothetical protein